MRLRLILSDTVCKRAITASHHTVLKSWAHVREMGNAHFSNVKPVLVKHSEIYTLSSERKTNTNPI